VTDAVRTRDDEPEGPVPALPAGLEPVEADEPNGLWAGPADDPDRFELLGSGLVGGEGTTFKARYHGEGGTPLPVAVKRLNRPPGASATWPSRADWDRWRDQVQVIQQVRSPHLVQVRAVFPGAEVHPRGSLPPAGGGRTYGVPYVVMEWVEGPSLDRLVRQGGRVGGAGTVRDGGLPLRRRGRLVAQLAEAVAALHSGTRTGGNPMLHRDIKPANCIVTPDAPPGGDRLVLVDIGTLRRADAGHDPRGMHSLHYTAPEVLADPRSPREPASDLYALGAVAFFCFTGKDPPVASSAGYLDHARAELDAALRDVRRRTRRRVRDHVLRLLDPDPVARAVVRPLPWARTLEHLLGRRRRYRRLALFTSPLTVPVATFTLLWATGVVTVEDAVEPPPGEAQDLAGLVAFGDAYRRFPVAVAGATVTVDPPG
jgi:serine/threonine protein kinase